MIRSSILSATLIALIPITGRAQSPAEKAESIRLKLRELDNSIAAPEYVGRNTESDLAAIRNLAEYRDYVKQVAEEFASQIATREQPYANLGYTLDGLAQHISSFEKAARDYGSAQMIQADLEHIQSMAKQAVEYQAPAYFLPENDISRRTEVVKVRIKCLDALSPNSAELKLAKEKLAATMKQVAEIQKSLSSKILEQNELPPDAYQQSDRQMLLNLIEEKWKQSGNKSPILKVGIVGTNWNRNQSWEFQNSSLYKVDQSRLQGYVIVAHDAKLAVRHSINLIKDHVDNEKTSLSFLNDPKAQPELTDQILRSKIK